MELVFKNKKIIDFFICIILFFLCYLAFFKNLGLYSLRTWDESRNAVTVLEMVKSNNWLIPTYLDVPDLWNTKPPILIWLQAINFKLFGVSEFNLRLPSAVSATLTVFIVYFFGAYGLKRKGIGLLSSLMLVSAMGFSDIHAARTGDYDSLLVLFTTCASIVTFLWLENQNKKYIWLASLLWAIAVLTKSSAGILFWPGLGLYLIFSKKVILLWKKKRDLVGPILMWFVLVFGFYFLENKINPGYLAAVWKNDLWGRYSEMGSDRAYSFQYYWDFMKNFRFQYWIYFWPISILGLLFPFDKKIKKWLSFSWCLVTVYFLIISMSETKQLWYDLPIYPLVVLAASSMVIGIVEILPWWLKLIPLLPVIFYLQRGVRTNLAYIARPDIDKNTNDCQKYGYLFSEVNKDWGGIDGVHGEYFCTPANFYFKLNGITRKEFGEIQSGDKVLSCHRPTLSDFRDKFVVVEENLPLECKIVTIGKLKQNNNGI